MTHPETDTPELGRLIADTRAERALTVQQVADRVHVTRETLSAWEHDRHLLPVTKVRPLAVALGISWREIASARAHDIRLRRRARLLDLGENA